MSSLPTKEPAKPTLQILYLEDNPRDRDLARRTLLDATLACSFIFTSSKAEYEAALDSQPFDLILSDFTLPAFNGIEALALAKATQPETPFIMVSGTIGEERAVAMLRAGATDYVLKNQLDRLPSVVRQALREAELRRTARRAEEALRASEARLHSFFNNATAGLCILDANQCFVQINETLARMNGPSVAGHLGRPIKEILPKLAPVLERILSQVLSSGRPQLDLQISGETAEAGNVRHWMGSYFPIPDPSGKSASVGCVVVEVTARRRAEAELQKKSEELTELLAHSPAVIYRLKLQGSDTKAVFVSDNIESLLGVSAGQALDHDWWTGTIHPDDRDRMLAVFAEILNSGGYSAQYRLRHRDGSYRWVEDFIRLTRNAEGQLAEAVGVWIDVTERKKLEEQFRQAQKMEAIGQLAGGVAHDFNNLLAVMRGNADLLLMEPEQLSAEMKDCLNQIVGAAERAASLTSQLLVFSRKQAIQSQPLLLNTVIVNVTKMLKRLIGEHIDLRCRLSDNLPHIQADPGMMEQVLVNLVVNARDAMPDGGWLQLLTESVTFGTGSAPVSAQGRTGEFVRLIVQDSGTGIAPDHLTRIFEPFFTTKEAGKGTGLGLATVYGIIAQHQGWIQVNSRLGQGTTFEIYLPAIHAPATEAAETLAELPLRGGSETILLVEDEFNVRTIIRRVLESYGYKVIEAACGPEALELWHAHGGKIDLLLTDMVMPGGLMGRELAQQLFAQKPGLRTIFMSGYSPELAGRDTDFLRHTKSVFLQKPCATRALIQTVRRCLDEPMQH